VVSEWNEEPSAAQKMDYDDTAKKISERQIQGAKTLNLLGGEPAVNLHGVLELLSRVNAKIKVVWNSNMYYNDIVDKLIAGLIDVYLADFKCGNNNCAKILLGAHSYTEVVKRNILNAVKNADVIIRHVVIPGHSECCLKPIFEWLATEIPDVKLSLRGNYVPPASAISAPKEYLKPDDLQYATELARNMDLKLVR
jgi:putative pyruvate formate lyase activating enzyme